MAHARPFSVLTETRREHFCFILHDHRSPFRCILSQVLMGSGGGFLQERIRELELANEMLRSREQTLAQELEDLQRVATRLMAADGVKALYAQILSAAVAILHADFATIQSYYPDRGADGELQLLDQQGLTTASVDRWKWVRWSARTLCAEALRTGRRVAVGDIRDCAFLAGSEELQSYLDLGVVGAQTTPLYSRSGSLLGMVSTFWRQPHALSGTESHALDVLARLAADLIERSRDEQELRESEERRRFAQQTAGIGSFDCNLESGTIQWTPELEAIYGLPPGGFGGTVGAWESLIHPDDRGRTVQLVTESIETGSPVEAEWRTIRPDGSVRWISGRWRVLRNQVGKPVRIMGVNLDTTHRKRMEEALRESEERLRLAVTATNDAIWDLDLRSGTVSWNETYARLYGRPENAQSCQWWIDRIHPDDRDRIASEFSASINGSASSWTAEYRFRRVDGNWAYVYDRAYIARDESGKAWRVIGALQDLTVRKQAEAALRETEARFRKMADAAPVMIWISGPDKRCSFFNKGWLEFRGRTLEEELGDGWAEGVHPEDWDQCFHTYSFAFDERRTFQMEYRLLRADGEYRRILDTGVPMFTSAGLFEGYIGSCIDITDLKRAQEENFHRQKLESIGMLAAGIAHDFNNLLGGILAQVQLIEDQIAAHSPLNAELQKITSLGIRASEIVRELMLYAGRETNGFETVDLSLLVGEMLELLKISISKRVVLKTSLATDLPPVGMQPSRIRQVVMNLVTNASEAIGNNEGVITVSTALAPADPCFVRLEISDTGCGMTQEQQTKIFDPFFTTKFVGRGLGLAVVQGVVRTHGGSIVLESAVGRGTTFRILLPVERAHASACASSSTENAAGDLIKHLVSGDDLESCSRPARWQRLR